MVVPFAHAQSNTPVAAPTDADKAEARDLRRAAVALYVRTRDPRLAGKTVQGSIRLDPKYSAAWFDLGMYAEASHDWATAVKGFGHYLALKPTGVDASRAAAELAVVKKYVVKPPTPAQLSSRAYEASLIRARVLMVKGSNQEAIMELGTAQKLLPNRWEAYALAAACMASQTRYDLANQFQEMALSRAPADKKQQIGEAVRASMR